MPNIKKATKTVTSEDATDKELAVIAQTGLREVIRTPITPLDLGEPFPRKSFTSFSRLIDVCCIAKTLRDFPMTALREDELGRFIELQSFFCELECKCLDEAGFE